MASLGFRAFGSFRNSVLEIPQYLDRLDCLALLNFKEIVPRARFARLRTYVKSFIYRGNGVVVMAYRGIGGRLSHAWCRPRQAGCPPPPSPPPSPPPPAPPPPSPAPPSGLPHWASPSLPVPPRIARLFQVLDLRLPTELDSLVPRKSEKADVAFPRRLRPLGAVCITLGSLRWRVGSDPFVAVCR